MTPVGGTSSLSLLPTAFRRRTELQRSRRGWFFFFLFRVLMVVVVVSGGVLLLCGIVSGWGMGETRAWERWRGGEHPLPPLHVMMRRRKNGSLRVWDGMWRK